MPNKLDILLPGKGRFESSGIFTDAKAGENFLLMEKCRIFYHNKLKLNIECPKSRHYYFKDMRGSEPVPDNYFVLSVTGYSEEPMHFEFYLD
ncbi:MAG: hypothetical protein J5940_00390 [Clostridia bacterium]|nr:hypothetical protein [Clostridia bacterium]